MKIRHSIAVNSIMRGFMFQKFNNANAYKLQLVLIYAPLISAIFLSVPSFAKQANCELHVAGFKDFKGTCDFTPEKGGSFSLSQKNVEVLVPAPSASYDEQDSIYLKIVAPGTGLLFGIGGAHQTGTYLATVYQQGACWVSHPPTDTINGDARVCAR